MCDNACDAMRSLRYVQISKNVYSLSIYYRNNASDLIISKPELKGINVECANGWNDYDLLQDECRQE